ncbi:MAG: YtxH domain-containing protein [Longimicrobiales bacterium]
MYYEEQDGALNFFVGVLVGSVIGAGVALLIAPQSGKRTRRQLVKAVNTAKSDAGDRWEEIADEVRGAVDAGRKKVRV